MTSPSREFTPAEAAAISDVAVKAVHNAIDKRILESRAQQRNVRTLTAGDILRLKLWQAVGGILSQERRQKLFSEIETYPAAKRVKADAYLIVDVEEARKEIAKRTRDLEAAEAAIVRNDAIMGGEPVFRGTRIPVRLIATMLDEGVENAEILDGYPKLDPRHLELARLWVAAHPRRGRPKSVADRAVTKQSRAPLKPDPGPTSARRRAP